VGYNPNYKWINPTYPIYNCDYILLTNWDEPPSEKRRYKGAAPDYEDLEAAPYDGSGPYDVGGPGPPNYQRKELW
jgi:hypothetical protein